VAFVCCISSVISLGQSNSRHRVASVAHLLDSEALWISIVVLFPDDLIHSFLKATIGWFFLHSDDDSVDVCAID